MASGDLTATNIFQGAAAGTALSTAIDSVNLPLATDMLFIIPLPNQAGQVRVVKVVRAA